MINVRKFCEPNSNYTILDYFDVKNKFNEFKNMLNSHFIKNYKGKKEIIKFKTSCDKNTAKIYAKRKKEFYDEINISSRRLEISDIQDVLGKKVFINNEKIYGWLIFIDEDILANWGHECKYIFYIGKKEGTEEDDFFEESMLSPPDSSLLLEVI